MKNSLIVSICLVALTVGVFAQNAAAQTSSPAPDTSVTPTATASVSPSSDLADKIHQRLEKKFGRHHGIVIDGHDSDEGSHGDIPEQVFPIVGITMITVFGAPVAIAVVTFSPIPIPLIAESEVHSADDHQLLPSRGPPAFLAV